MAKINENFLNLKGGYLFSEIARRVNEFKKANPQREILRLGVGDVTLPLVPAVVEALEKASAEMGNAETFRGYGPEYGYDFLREAIAQNDFQSRGVNISADEIFISDGAKSDCGNIGDIFGVDNIVALGDPVYPVYVDTNVMGGRSGDAGEDGRYSKIVYLPCTEQNGFTPFPPSTHADIVYLCSPNNPTGSAATKEQLKAWGDYAKKEDAIILFDAAYEAFITDDSIPHSIFEIEGAKECAIEFRSFSKTAGFTGTRCGFTVVPKEVCGKDSKGNKVPLQKLWERRQGTKFNGVPYVIQRAAEAVYSVEGKKQVKANIKYYLDNAALIKKGLTAAGFTAFGGENSPYVWVKTPENMGSWQFFDYLLETYAIVTTPGEGFGQCGEGYIRFSALGSREVAEKAVNLLTK